MTKDFQNNHSFQRFTSTNLIIASLLSVAYLALAYFFIGWRPDHWHLCLALLVAYFAFPLSRKIFWAFLFFIIYWLIYDSLRVYPNYMVNPVSIENLYNLEKSIFGIQTDSGLLTPNEFAKANSHWFLDVLAPSFYLCWVPLPMLFVIYLFFTDKSTMARFTAAFLLINIIGLIIYYIYPAAPPWYVEKYGFEFIAGTPGSAARLLRFDEFFGVDIFKNMYEKNGNVFAAIPSLHSAFPVLLVYYGVKKRLIVASIFFFTILGGIWFAAVYTNHHYIIDVLLGGTAALFSILLLEKVLLKTKVRDWLQKYERLL
ncbi:MAG: phosphatase PAP2 family protein [Bacteroidota bacterium]